MGASRGAIGLLAEPHSYVSVDRFVVAGRPEPVRLAFLYTEGWLGAGENPAHWIEQKDATFRFGAGAVRREKGGRAKWNFLGSSCTLWSPKGPDYGKVEVRLDGMTVGTVDLHSAQAQNSQPVFSRSGLSGAFHAVVLEPQSGRWAVDSIEVGN